MCALLANAVHLRDHGVHLPVAVAVSRLYRDHADVLPNRNGWIEFTLLVVRLMAGFRVNSGETAPAAAQFSADANQVSGMLTLIWGQTTDTEVMQKCLHAFYVIISTEGGMIQSFKSQLSQQSFHSVLPLFSDSFGKPSCALLRVIEKIPKHFLDGATKTILDDSCRSDGEAKTVVGLQVRVQLLEENDDEPRLTNPSQNMIEWLTMLPATPLVSQWILEMMKGLRDKDRNSVLIEIAHSSTEKVRSAMTYGGGTRLQLNENSLSALPGTLRSPTEPVRRAHLLLPPPGVPAL